MTNTLNDWIYLLERTFPNLAGAGSFFAGVLVLNLLCLACYFYTRKKTCLLTMVSSALYVLPLVI